MIYEKKTNLKVDKVNEGQMVVKKDVHKAVISQMEKNISEMIKAQVTEVLNQQTNKEFNVNDEVNRNVLDQRKTKSTIDRSTAQKIDEWKKNLIKVGNEIEFYANKKKSGTEIGKLTVKVTINNKSGQNLSVYNKSDIGHDDPENFIKANGTLKTNILEGEVMVIVDIAKKANKNPRYAKLSAKDRAKAKEEKAAILHGEEKSLLIAMPEKTINNQIIAIYTAPDPNETGSRFEIIINRNLDSELRRIDNKQLRFCNVSKQTIYAVLLHDDSSGSVRKMDKTEMDKRIKKIPKKDKDLLSKKKLKLLLGEDGAVVVPISPNAVGQEQTSQSIYISQDIMLWQKWLFKDETGKTLSSWFVKSLKYKKKNIKYVLAYVTKHLEVEVYTDWANGGYQGEIGRTLKKSGCCS